MSVFTVFGFIAMAVALNKSPIRLSIHRITEKLRDAREGAGGEGSGAGAMRTRGQPIKQHI